MRNVMPALALLSGGRSMAMDLGRHCRSMHSASPSGALPIPPLRRPTLRFMFAHPAHVIALGFGAGLAPRAPGTVGTLWAWAAFVLMQRWLPAGALGWIILASLALGWWACTVTARHMAIADPGA